jgi:hypothetical protein
VVNLKFAEEQPQVFRLRLPLNHRSDEDLSPGAPVTRQTSLKMTAFVQRSSGLGRWCPVSEVVMKNIEGPNAGSSAHDPQTEVRLGPLSLGMTPELS